jgi:hypothetical protein
MTPGGLWASRRIHVPYHVESDDIFEGDLACLEPSHEVSVDTFGRRTSG